MSTGTVLVYFFAVFLLYILARVFAGPFRMMLSFLLYFTLGVVLLVLGNLVGRLFGATVSLNPYTAVLAGFLNVPGVILLFLIRYWLRL